MKIKFIIDMIVTSFAHQSVFILLACHAFHPNDCFEIDGITIHGYFNDNDEQANDSDDEIPDEEYFDDEDYLDNMEYKFVASSNAHIQTLFNSEKELVYRFRHGDLSTILTSKEKNRIDHICQKQSIF